MLKRSVDTFKTSNVLKVGSEIYHFYDLQKLSSAHPVKQLPFCLKILLENLLRHEDGINISVSDIQAVLQRSQLGDVKKQNKQQHIISFSPARVVLQDFTGVPALVDLAAMRAAMIEFGSDPEKINPKVPVDLVIDHSVMVDHYGSAEAYVQNTQLEFERNQERYNFLRWGQRAFKNFRVVPPGTGIVHQVNLEYLAQCVMTRTFEQETWAYPDTLVGTDSHTTMINGLGVLGWGVGGIEAEAGMLGQPLSMLLPEVVGFELSGALPEGATATDLVLTVTQMLRKASVVGKFVEFYGSGLSNLTLADRATIANMAPEYGATTGIFPIDDETLRYLSLTGRDAKQVALVEAYAKHQGLWRDDEAPALYDHRLQLDLQQVEPSLAGPTRPQDRVALSFMAKSFEDFLNKNIDSAQYIIPPSGASGSAAQLDADSTSRKNAALSKRVPVTLNHQSFELTHGDVAIAAITSCTNTSNPSVMIAAGLLAKKARALGLTAKPWVKTSLAPGSQVVPAYLERAGLLEHMQALGFHVVGFGCTTCIGNSGPIAEPIRNAIQANRLVVASVLSGNRNFEGRIHSDVRANYLASPPLVIAYAIAGTVNIDLTAEPLGDTPDGKPIYLSDIWPSSQEINALVGASIDTPLFQKGYQDVFSGNQDWQSLPVPSAQTYTWPDSTYIKKPPFFVNMPRKPLILQPLKKARCLVMLGDSITTDHISPAGSIPVDSPAGHYLSEEGVLPHAFNSLGSRRGNHEVMMRGTFANIRLKNELAPGTNGGFTQYFPDRKITTIYEAAENYRAVQTPLIVIAGKEYGTGSSRDWAAKGTNLLGVKAVIAESYERIHRSNLVGFGVLPLQFLPGQSAKSLGLKGDEIFSFEQVPSEDKPMLTVKAEREQGESARFFDVTIRVDTPSEWEYFIDGGILHHVLRRLINED